MKQWIWVCPNCETKAATNYEYEKLGCPNCEKEMYVSQIHEVEDGSD